MTHFEPREHRHPVHVRHDEIEKHERELVAPWTVQKIERRLAPRCGDGCHSRARDRRFEQSALDGIIVHDKYGLCHCFLARMVTPER